MTGTGRSGGAGTIVNAMATGRGAAFGLGFLVEARVRPADAWSVFSHGRRLPPAQSQLALRAARLVQGRSAHAGPWRIDVTSDIPPERGLKSSSAVAIAVVRAALDELGHAWGPTSILRAAAQANLDAGVSLTGAYDDAAACLLGGVCLTDNGARRLVRRTRLPAGLEALVHIPPRRLPTRAVKGTDFSTIRPFVDQAWRLARQGDLRAAMALNTTAYAPLFGHTPRFTVAALDEGAWAAGLSGKGPAEVALGTPPTIRSLRRRFPRARRVPLRNRGVA